MLVVSPSKNRIPADLQQLNAIFFLYSPVCVLSLSPHVKESVQRGGGWRTCQHIAQLHVATSLLPVWAGRAKQSAFLCCCGTPPPLPAPILHFLFCSQKSEKSPTWTECAGWLNSEREGLRKRGVSYGNPCSFDNFLFLETLPFSLLLPLLHTLAPLTVC